MFCCVMAIVITIVVTAMLVMQKKSEDEYRQKKERFEDGEKLEALLCSRRLDDALSFLDTLKTKYPHDPLLCLGEGWVHDMQGDSLRARASFKRGICMYDSLIAEKDDYGLRLNKAFLVLIVDGRKAFDKAMNEVLPFAKTKADSIGINELRKMLYYNKKDLFDKGAKNSSHGRYRCEGNVKLDEPAIEINIYDGKVSTGFYWGTSEEFAETDGKDGHGGVGHFVLPLSDIRNEDNNTVYFELDMRGQRFFRETQYPNVINSNTVPRQALCDDGEMAVKDSIILMRAYIGNDCVIIDNLSNKSLGKRVFQRCDKQHTRIVMSN